MSHPWYSMPETQRARATISSFIEDMRSLAEASKKDGDLESYHWYESQRQGLARALEVLRP